MWGRRDRGAFVDRFAPRSDLPDSRVPMSVSTRLSNLRQQLTPIVQLSVGAGIAWFIAHNLIGHSQPFFAPVAAVVSIAAAIGQRRQLVVQLVLGVSVGILVGELLIQLIGRGGWQITVIVALAAATATLIGLKGLARTQAATSAVLLAAVVPVAGSGNPATNRFVDALTGGLVGLAMTIVVPGNPVRRVDQEVQKVLRGLGAALDQIANSLELRDAGPAWTALHQARALQPTIEGLGATISGADEVARISPLRWGQRDHVRLYSLVLRDIDNAVRDVRVLARRVHTMIRLREQPPEGMDVAVRSLSEAVAIFSDDLAEHERFDEARDKLVSAARTALESLPRVLTVNGAATAAQVRATASDLLYATGLTPPEIDELLNPELDEGQDRS